MPTPTIAELDLRSAILNSRADHRWWSTPDARTLLAAVLDALTPIARRVNADPADALSYAFEVWVGLSDELLADETVDLVAYTRTAVRHLLDREDEAARKITSAAAVRRAGTRAAQGFTALDDTDLAAPADDDVDEPHELDPRSVRAGVALEQVLVMAGFNADQRLIVIDVLSDALDGSPSARASIARAEAVHDVIDSHLTAAQWRILVEVILGTPAGKPGIVQLAASGHPAPAIEPHISTRLVDLLAGAA